MEVVSNVRIRKVCRNTDLTLVQILVAIFAKLFCKNKVQIWVSWLFFLRFDHVKVESKCSRFFDSQSNVLMSVHQLLSGPIYFNTVGKSIVYFCLIGTNSMLDIISQVTMNWPTMDLFLLWHARARIYILLLHVNAISSVIIAWNQAPRQISRTVTRERRLRSRPSPCSAISLGAWSQATVRYYDFFRQNI